jgi:hypothetical protein
MRPSDRRRQLVFEGATLERSEQGIDVRNQDVRGT